MTAAENPLSVLDELKVANVEVGLQARRQWRARRCVPDTHTLVSAQGNHPTTVWAEARLRDLLTVDQGRRQFFAAGAVPDPCATIVARGNDPSSIRTKRGIIDAVVVPESDPDSGSRFPIPKLRKALVQLTGSATRDKEKT